MSKTEVFLVPSLIDEARSAAEAEAIGLNQFVNAAVAEKISAIFANGLRGRTFPGRLRF